MSCVLDVHCICRVAEPGGPGWLREAVSEWLCRGPAEGDQEHQQEPQQPGQRHHGPGQQGGQSLPSSACHILYMHVYMYMYLYLQCAV